MQLFTFIYSKRTGTAAASMPDPITHKEKTQRIARVLAIQEQVVAKLGGAMVGKTVRALVEGPGREEGTLTARLDNNMTVDFAGGDACGRVRRCPRDGRARRDAERRACMNPPAAGQNNAIPSEMLQK